MGDQPPKAKEEGPANEQNFLQGTLPVLSLSSEETLEVSAGRRPRPPPLGISESLAAAKVSHESWAARVTLAKEKSAWLSLRLSGWGPRAESKNMTAPPYEQRKPHSKLLLKSHLSSSLKPFPEPKSFF